VTALILGDLLIPIVIRPRHSRLNLYPNAIRGADDAHACWRCFPFTIVSTTVAALCAEALKNSHRAFASAPLSPLRLKFTITFLARCAAAARESPVSIIVRYTARRIAFSPALFRFSRYFSE
jgi:hypothetical protein